MSILCTLCGSQLADWQLLGSFLPGVLFIMSVVIGIRAGVIPPRKVNGPDRIPPGRSAFVLLMALFAAVFVYMFSANVYVEIISWKDRATTVATTQEFSPQQTAFLSTIPPLLSLVTLFLGERLVRPRLGHRLGVEPRDFPVGFKMGLLGTAIVVPSLFLSSQLLEFIYYAIHYLHPTEHPLLQLLGQGPGWQVMVPIIIGACLIAPVFEEFLFRGFLQTLIRRMLLRLALISQPNIGLSVPDDLSKTVLTWVAVLITSLVFALLHPGWTRPIIFLLSICLGYAYERTANLWVTITIHAAFNSIETALFLIGMYSHR